MWKESWQQYYSTIDEATNTASLSLYFCTKVALIPKIHIMKLFQAARILITSFIFNTY